MVTLRQNKKTDLDQFLMVFLKQNMSCYRCQLLEICVPGEMPAELLEALQKAIDQNQSLDKDAVLVRPGDDLTSLYALKTGSLKAWQVDESGRERILDFYLPGELIGLEAIAKKQHPFHIKALEESTYCRVNYAKLTQIIQQKPQLQTHLLMLASNKLNQHAGLLSADAETRLLEFLNHLRQRLRKESTTVIKLSMSRADLGNYLNLTPETISRLFTRLQQNGVLSSRGKRIEFQSNQII